MKNKSDKENPQSEWSGTFHIKGIYGDGAISVLEEEH